VTAVESESTIRDEAALEAEHARRYRSHRGDYEIYTAPPLAKPMQPDELSDDAVADVVDLFDCSEIIDDDHGEDAVRGSVAHMIRAISPGSIVTPLFSQSGTDGMSLIHAWFGPNFPLFRHSHPKLGDCLYYIVAGSAVLGNRVLGPGDCFFVPNGMPYKYRAGPEGVEILEFRAGGGDPDAPIIKLHEPHLEAVDRITEAAESLHGQWHPPARVADTPRAQH